jgi:hypothetical protein
MFIIVLNLLPHAECRRYVSHETGDPGAEFIIFLFLDRFTTQSKIMRSLYSFGSSSFSACKCSTKLNSIENCGSEHAVGDELSNHIQDSILKNENVMLSVFTIEDIFHMSY